MFYVKYSKENQENLLTDTQNHVTIGLYSKVLYRKGIGEMEEIIRRKMRVYMKSAENVESERILTYRRLWKEMALVLMEAGLMDKAEMEWGLAHMIDLYSETLSRELRELREGEEE